MVRNIAGEGLFRSTRVSFLSLELGSARVHAVRTMTWCSSADYDIFSIKGLIVASGDGMVYAFGISLIKTRALRVYKLIACDPVR